ncbi:Cyclin-dependent kinase 7 [Dionaea muscipula]
MQLLVGLKYLHSKDILHRDLKSGNLLVNANSELKICESGQGRTTPKGFEGLMTEYVVTRWYRAPELLLWCSDYGASIDVWSVGCILVELLGREPLFPGTDSLHQLRLIINVLGTPWNPTRSRGFIRSLPYSQGTNFSHLYPNADPLAIDLLQRLLVFNPSRRITVTEAL